MTNLGATARHGSRAPQLSRREPQPESAGSHLDAEHVWIVDGGPKVPRHLPDHQPTCVIAVDRGLRHCDRLGMRPDVVLGDMDSVTPSALARGLAQWPDLTLLPYFSDKARSDLDLALSFVWGLDPARITLLSGAGGRLDHSLIGATLLARPVYAALPLIAYVGDSVLQAVTAGMELELHARDGNLVTLMAVGGAAALQSSGLRWPLSPRDGLASASSLGLSNELTADQARIVVREGSVLAIQSRGATVA